MHVWSIGYKSLLPEGRLNQDEDGYNKQIEAFESTYWSSDLMRGALPHLP